MTPINDMLTDLMYEYPQLPGSILGHYARRALAMMCRRGDLVREERVLTYAPGETFRDIVPEAGDVDVWSVMRVAPDMADGELPLRGARLLNHEPAPGEVRGRVFWFEPPDRLMRSGPAGFHSGGFESYRVVYSTVPTADACRVADVLARDHYEVFLDGVRHLVHGTPGKPWSDHNLAAALRQKFERGVDDAKVFDLIGHVKAPMRRANRRIL
jgi:hypothetical protein